MGAVACLYLVLPWSSGRPGDEYRIAGVLLLVGVALWAVAWFTRDRTGTPAAASDDEEREAQL